MGRALGRTELHNASPAVLANHVQKVVAIKARVHTDVVIQRVTSGAGLNRAGRRIREAVNNAIRYAQRNGMFVRRGDFLWAVTNQEIHPRDRSNLTPQDKKLQLVAPEEIEAAIVSAVGDAFSIYASDAMSGGLGLVGFRRVFAGEQDIVRAVLERAVSEGKMKQQAGLLTLSDAM